MLARRRGIAAFWKIWQSYYEILVARANQKDRGGRRIWALDACQPVEWV